MKLHVTVALATAAMLFAGCSHDKNNKETQARMEAMAQPEIDVATPQVRTVTVYKTYPGYLSANREVDLVARVNGYLTSIPYEAGSFVKAGTVLFSIEDRQYSDAVAQCKSQLDNARATLDYSTRNYAAMKKALESDAVSQMEVLQAKNAMETARAQVENAQAALRTATTTLSYCTVRAPFDGHVSNSPYNDGAYLNGAGAPVTLGKIYDDAVMTANFAIDDQELLNLINSRSKALALDMDHIPLNFTDTLPHAYTGKLSYLAPNINRNTGSMTVQAHINNPWGELRSGMYVTIDLPSGVEHDAVLVNDAAISTDQLGKYMYVLNDSDKVVYTPVKVANLVDDTLRVVTSGIHPGDRYVTKALLKVRDGMRVKPRLTK